MLGFNSIKTMKAGYIVRGQVSRRLEHGLSPESGRSEISLRISPPPQSSQIEEWFDIDAFDSGVGPEIELRNEPEMESEWSLK